MATTSLKDHLVCGQCKDLFTDPQLLTCRHTYCMRCVEGLLQQDKLKCPECDQSTSKEEILPNKKLQAYIDFYKQHQEFDTPVKEEGTSPECTPKTVCDMCKNEDNPIISKCSDCKQLMCSSCDVTHRGMKLFRDHKVNNIQQEIKLCQIRVREFILLLEKKREELKNKLQDIGECEAGMKLKQTSLEREVKSVMQKMIQQTESYRVFMNHGIEDGNIHSMSKLSQCYNKAATVHRNFVKQIQDLSKRAESKDLTDLIQTRKYVRQLKVDIEAQLKEIDKYSKTMSNLPYIEVIEGERFDLDKCVKIEQGDFVSMTSQNMYFYIPLQNHEHSVFTNALQRYWKIGQRVKTKGQPRTVCFIGSELWCVTSDAIYMYTYQCRLKRELKHNEINAVNAVCKMFNGEVILACTDGLKVMNHFCTSGVSLCAEGSYADVCSFQQECYALEYNLRTLQVYGHEGDESWKKIKAIDLPGYDKGSPMDKVLVDDFCGVCISCYDNHCLYVYSLHGELLRQTGSQGSQGPGKLRHPVLCFEQEGGILVADEGNDQLQMYSVHTANWYIMLEKGLVKSPSHCCMNSDNENYYVISAKTQEIIRFICK